MGALTRDEGYIVVAEALSKRLLGSEDARPGGLLAGGGGRGGAVAVPRSPVAYRLRLTLTTSSRPLLIGTVGMSLLMIGGEFDLSSVP